MTFPGNIKDGVNARSLLLTYFLSRTDRPYLPHLISRPPSTWGKLIQFMDRCFLGNHSFIIYSFLVDQLILKALNWMFNSCSDISNSFRLFTVQGISSQVDIKILELSQYSSRLICLLPSLNITRATGLINLITYCYRINQNTEESPGDLLLLRFQLKTIS